MFALWQYAEDLGDGTSRTVTITRYDAETVAVEYGEPHPTPEPAPVIPSGWRELGWVEEERAHPALAPTRPLSEAAVAPLRNAP